MSDAKAKDQGDQHQVKTEVQPLQAPDAQVVRLSGHVEMNRVEQARTNASDGSLRHYQPTNHAGRKLPADWHEQNRSLELQDGEVSISRVNPLREANLASPDKKNANGKPYQVYTAEASQALQKPDEISKALTEGEYQSKTKLNVQITNVPEVSPGLNPQEAIKYISTVMDAGAAAVRPLEHHMTEPGAINSDIEKTATHFKQSPFQFEKDVLGAFLGAVDKLDKPMTAEQRAGAAGALMPMFFFEGGAKPIDKAAVNQMKLDQMTAEELKMLGIERTEMNMPQIPENLRDLPLTRADQPLLDAVRDHNRDILFAEPGSEAERHLNVMEAEASVFNTSAAEPDIILLRPQASKISVLEEFLHGTQRTIDALKDKERVILELHVKDFMIRHRKLLGLSNNDIEMLEAMKDRELRRAEMQGHR
jgi:hypothetical protein